MHRPAEGTERLFAEVAAEYGGALERLARGYERDSDKRRDLLQEIHVGFVAQPGPLRRPLLDANVGLPGGAQRGHVARDSAEDARADLGRIG